MAGGAQGHIIHGHLSQMLQEYPFCWLCCLLLQLSLIAVDTLVGEFDPQADGL